MKSNRKDITVEEANAVVRPAVLEAKLSFTIFTQEAMMAAKYAVSKPTATLLLKKGDPTAEKVVAAIEAANRATGSNRDVVKDGDSEKLQKYNAGYWVVKVKCGPRVKLVDTKKNPLGFEAFDMGDRIRCGLSLFDYSDGDALAGISVYLNWAMLVEKGGYDNIPDFDGEGFVSTATRTTTMASDTSRVTAMDDDDDDMDEKSDHPPGNETLTQMLIRQRRQRAQQGV